MNERVARAKSAVILYDSGLSAQPDASWMQPEWWIAQAAVRAELGGRGRAMRVETPVGEAVLRRYWRGGWMAPLLKERYWRLSATQSRAIREFRLLSRLRQLGLPVPQPLAASFEPVGLFYRAGLLTHWLPDTRQLATVAEQLSLPEWRALASLLVRFFQVGLVHPDLNAHNLLLDAQGRWYLIDFDRAQLSDRPESAKRMVERLARSLARHCGDHWRDGFDRYLRNLP